MKRNVTRLVLGLAVVLIIAIILLTDRKEIGNEPGMIAENFELPAINTDKDELYDYEGDVIILNMWASWCEPCIREMPAFMELQENYKDQGLSVITVNMQTFERTLHDASDFIEEMDFTLPVFFDEDGIVAERYNIIGMPTTYIISRDGTIEHLIRMEVEYESLEEMITPLL